jgi:hypothetical protein
MSTLVESRGGLKQPWLWFAAGTGILLIWGLIAFPAMHGNLLQTPSERIKTRTEFLSATVVPDTSLPGIRERESMKLQAIPAPAAVTAVVDQKIIRTSSLDLVVQHPAEFADKIAALAENSGGYVETSEGGGPDSTSARLTIRVPALQFDTVRTVVRKLGIRVEGEKIDAQDVTRQYVDQDAGIRNLRAEEAQHLAILKQARTVKDMLAVTENLSAVRGQIEQQQAEFNALSRQVDTVALTISLRAEAQEQTFRLNWRPGYQLKLALHDGLESLASYTATMIAILFYLPATLLWVGTILVAMVVGWRTIRWAGRQWFGWNEATKVG